jgi:hypothetical protein
MGLRGLELRANHAVAIEPISGRGHPADFLRSNVAELAEDPPERTGNQLQKERYYRKFRAPRGALRSCRAGLIALTEDKRQAYLDVARTWLEAASSQDCGPPAQTPTLWTLNPKH